MVQVFLVTLFLHLLLECSAEIIFKILEEITHYFFMKTGRMNPN